MQLTKSQFHALQKAASRERGNLCPVVTHRGRVHAAAETAILEALSRRGLIDNSEWAPRINDAGRKAINSPAS